MRVMSVWPVGAYGLLFGGPIGAIWFSFFKDVDYSFFINYRKWVFPALLVHICLRLAQKPDPDWRKTWLLVILAVLNNPIRLVHFGIVWPWLIINAATLIFSFWAVTKVRDCRLRENKQRWS